ncbi:MAG TPA: hypothetical protein VFF79_13070 [Conexibacter sp.]|jgi:hypothetical protein|nr:hypothetical protein [Conexibacter sp.]
MQLAIDGSEVPMARVRPARVTPAQREILRALRMLGELRSWQAGRILHAHREHGCRQQESASHRGGAETCCGYCSSDGGAAMKRLARRGVVERVERGRWRLA